MTSQLRIIAVAFACWSLSPSTADAAGKMVEIVLEGQKYTGRVLSHQGNEAWFLERDGRLRPITLTDVSDYRVLGPFRPYTAVELRDQLTRELGRGFVVSTTGQYVVATAKGVEGQYPAQFEELYRQFVVMFGARGFKMTRPEFPLVAIVFPTEEAFHVYCASEGIQPQPGLRGYYLPASNRVALYDSTTNSSGANTALDSTIIHEAVHQVAFNTGIHSRTGTNPKWVVEGLATALEVAALRANEHHTTERARANPSRLKWFEELRSRRAKPDFADLIGEDRAFSASALDAYSDAWALTFYLLEKRSADYTAYLKRLAERDPQLEYTSEQRLADFQKSFGRDLSLLESRVVRFIDDVAAE
ncbi:DUF1570 domain-containing protein [bacterium]|nr:DUF1570 domain-containing protein [bacterium]